MLVPKDMHHVRLLCLSVYRHLLTPLSSIQDEDKAAKALARAATKELKVCIRLCWGDGAQMLYAVVPSSE